MLNQNINYKIKVCPSSLPDLNDQPIIIDLFSDQIGQLNISNEAFAAY